MKLSLRNRFLIPTVLAVILGTCILTTVSYLKSSSAIEKSTQGQLTLVLDSTRKNINGAMSGFKQLVNDWKDDEVFRAAVQGKPEEPAAKSACDRLAAIIKNFPQFERVNIVNRLGNAVASSDQRALNIDFADRTYFKEALNGKFNVSEVMIGKTTGNPVAMISAPLKFHESIVGVLTAVLDIKHFGDDYIDTVKIGEKGYAFMFGRDGLMLANPDRSLNNKFNLNETEFGRQMLAGKQGLVVYKDKGEEKIAAYTQPEQLGVTICVVADAGEVFAPVHNIRSINIVLSVSMVFFTGLIVLLIAKSITNPIGKTTLTLMGAADQVTQGSNSVSSSSQQLAEGASEQAASIEEISSSLEEMASMIKQNAGNASHANQLMNEAKDVIARANGSMGDLIKSMGDISRASEETSKIIKTIDEIAFQTNLLALNAAVEAARAGEAGAGFAVVADEVRKLAMRAAEAAKNTANLIDDTVKRIKEGSEVAVRTNSEFARVEDSSAKMRELVGEIAAASTEQSQGIDQISKAVGEMDKVVQQNSANAEETASASEEMSAQAEHMKEFVSELVALVSGRNANGSVVPGRTASRPARVLPTEELDRDVYYRPKGNGKSPVHYGKRGSGSAQTIPFEEEEISEF